MATCNKCGGTGHLPHYAHIHNGVCYECNGSGDVASPEMSSGYRATAYNAEGQEVAIIGNTTREDAWQFVQDHKDAAQVEVVKLGSDPTWWYLHPERRV